MEITIKSFLNEIKNATSFSHMIGNKVSNHTALNDAKYFANMAKEFVKDRTKSDDVILDKITSANTIEQVRKMFK